MGSPKVSIVIPIYNVEKYLRQCLDSVINQTLKDTEIICVNDGSKDSSLDIILEYAAKDPRIVVINKENSGYGNSMNRGFDIAKGEYIGIIESDDYAELNMFEALYNCAKKDDLDVVKSGFFFYYSKPAERNVPSPVASKTMCSRVFCPATDFKSPKEQVEFFNIKPTIWSAIYKKDFIRANNIRFNETPGASYQDASFNFKVWACAKRVRLVQDCFLHYRQDNESSSINSPGKVFCICDEYDEMRRFLDERPILKGHLAGVMTRIKYDSYVWNYERLKDVSLKRKFLARASADFAEDMEQGLCEFKYYPYYKWNGLLLIIKSPEEYHQWRVAEKKRELMELNTAMDQFQGKKLSEKELKEELFANGLLDSVDDPIPSPEKKKKKLYPDESFPHKLKRKMIGGYYCWKEHGVIYTLNNLKEKIKRGRL